MKPGKVLNLPRAVLARREAIVNIDEMKRAWSIADNKVVVTLMFLPLDLLHYLLCPGVLRVPRGARLTIRRAT